MKNREELEHNLTNVMDEIKKQKGSRRIFDKIKNNLYKNYGVPTGDTQKIIQGADPLNELDTRLLCLFTVETFKETKQESVNWVKYFTEHEVIDSRTSYEPEEEGVAELPQTLPNTLQISPEDYVTTMSIKEIKTWMRSGILDYNFETQREARQKRVGNQIIQEAKTNERSVKEIAEHLLKGTLMSTVLTFNVPVGSADNGKDIEYSQKDQSLTINGKMDIIDGYHRVQGSLRALLKNPDLDFSFIVSIKNYRINTARQYVGQINKVNPMQSSRLKELSEDREADWIVKELQRSTQLQGKVAQTNKTALSLGQFVSFGTLSDAIDEVYKLKNRKDSLNVLDYLSDFFDKLILNIDTEENIKTNNMAVQNPMFYGYVVLSKKMLDNNIPVRKIKDILNEIDFSRSSPLWREIGVLDEKEVITNRAKNKIKDYFSNVNLSENVSAN